LQIIRNKSGEVEASLEVGGKLLFLADDIARVIFAQGSEKENHSDLIESDENLFYRQPIHAASATQRRPRPPKFIGIEGGFNPATKPPRIINVKLEIISKIENEKDFKDYVENLVRQYPDLAITPPVVDKKHKNISFSVTSFSHSITDAEVKETLNNYIDMKRLQSKIRTKSLVDDTRTRRSTIH
jgi:hypothetical protein